MTRQEAISALEKWHEGSDEEIAHGLCDEVLVNFLYDNGYEDVAQAWMDARTRVGFWYA